MSGSLIVGSWDELARRRVCFGHQSVGASIVGALSTLSEQRLRIVESIDPEVFHRPVFAHFRVGHNRDPLSKCQAFSEAINAGIGDRIDVAFFKFCYVDITAQTDVNALFKAYQDVMSSLSNAFPKVMFLHVTVPLTRIEGGMLGWLREQIGGIDHEREDQVRRHAFNQRLRGVYGESGGLFDLAEVEATFPDGKASYVHYRGTTLPSLVPGYTDDGGHLTRHASEQVAVRLLASLHAAGIGPNKIVEGQGHSR